MLYLPCLIAPLCPCAMAHYAVHVQLSALPNVKLHVSPMDASKLRDLNSTTALFIAHATVVCLIACLQDSHSAGFTPQVTDFPAGTDTPPQLQRWRSVIQASSPRAALTTFQLPWPDVKGPATSNYFDGQLRYPVWGQQTGCECVLVVTDMVGVAVSNLAFGLTRRCNARPASGSGITRIMRSSCFISTRSSARSTLSTLIRSVTRHTVAA